MKVKLDENIGGSVLQLFEQAGHDTSSIQRQGLQGAPDQTVYRICRDEGRVLVTLDLDFANPLAYDPRPTPGIAVIRLSRNPAPSELVAAVEALLGALERRPILNALWILRNGRIRAWQPDATDSG